MHKATTISKYLTIVLITYNREEYLKNTLSQLLDSPFKECPIVVLNNCSTDNTYSVAQAYQHSLQHLNIITNKFNIGANANILRTVEYSDTEYTWIIADDDHYNFSDCDDIIDRIIKKDVILIQVGGHVDKNWTWGMQENTPKKLMENGYLYFKYSSFIASSIFKTSFFIENIVRGYNNIGNSYPHMPYLFTIYDHDEYIYISKNRIVLANNSSGSYDNDQLLNWWIRTSKLLANKEDQQRCFIEQYDKNRSKYGAMTTLLSKFFKRRISWKNYSRAFSFFSFLEIIIFIFLYFPYYTIKYLIKR